MKKLTITLSDNVMFDGDVTEFEWHESNSTVSLKAALRRDGQGGGGSALLDVLAGAARKREPARPPNDG